MNRRETVHPRACGEHINAACYSHVFFGSSPRLRGTLSHNSDNIPCRRFIPAPAGNTPKYNPQQLNSAVHPRACGEHPVLSLRRPDLFGSSPRLRGTRPRAASRRAGGRFIPAPAGNTLAEWRPSRAATVHPRACGEHGEFHELGIGRAGSSPRLRGTRAGQARRNNAWRFIPAPAGNTRLFLPWLVSISVHPRACGEHAMRAKSTPLKSGSSPRLRGTHCPAKLQNACDRFIPAPAGNTLRSYRLRRGSAVHPRACGEHLTLRIKCVLYSGSSPRLRGTRR